MPSNFWQDKDFSKPLISCVCHLFLFKGLTGCVFKRRGFRLWNSSSQLLRHVGETTSPCFSFMSLEHQISRLSSGMAEGSDTNSCLYYYQICCYPHPMKRAMNLRHGWECLWNNCFFRLGRPWLNLYFNSIQGNARQILPLKIIY